MKAGVLLLVGLFLTGFFIDSDYENYFPKTQQITEDSNIVALGRTLFHDPILSRDSTIACASCHSQYNSFAHSDHALSHGIEDRIGNRNAPALMNLQWQSSFMWDGASNSLEAQVLAPITNRTEMDNTLSNVIATLRSSERYRTLFKNAFHDTVISIDHLTKAIAQFERTFISVQSRYDSMKRKLIEFSDKEKKGYALFLKHCNACHKEPLFSTYAFASNGISIDTSLKDFGRFAITFDEKDKYAFKIPTLRNVQYSAPYMHDGRMKSLKEVINFYSDSIPYSASSILQSPFHFQPDEKVELLSFLITLTDKSFLFNKNFSNR